MMLQRAMQSLGPKAAKGVQAPLTGLKLRGLKGALWEGLKAGGRTGAPRPRRSAFGFWGLGFGTSSVHFGVGDLFTVVSREVRRVFFGTYKLTGFS